MREIVITPFDNEYEEEIVEKICTAIDNDKNYILFLPTRELLNEYRLKILEKKEVAFSLNFKTFDDFLLESTRDPVKEKLLQNLFIRLAIEKAFQSGKLEKNSYYYSEGFVSLSIQFIMDLKSSLKTGKIDELMKNPTLNDFGIIYFYYEEILEKYHYKDTYDHYLDFNIEDDLDLVIVNGFYELRPIEELMIEKLVEKTKDFSFYFQMPEHQTFKNYTKLLEKLESLGFSKRLVSKRAKSPFEKLSEIYLKQEKVDTETKLVEAMDLYSEIYYTGLKILEDGEENFSKTAVIVEDKDTLPIIEKIFQDFNIPSNQYYTEDLLKSVKLREFKSLLEVEYEIDFLLYYLKSSFLEEEEGLQEGIFTLVKYLNSMSSYTFEELEELEDYKEIIINYGLEELLAKIRLEFQNFQDSQYILKTFTEILKDLDSDLADTSLEYLKEFISFFKTLSYDSLKSFLLTLIDHMTETISLEGVFVGNMLQARNQVFDKIYFLQMNDDVFPNLPKVNSYYNESNFLDLKSYDLALLSEDDYFDINKMRFIDTLSSAKKEIVFLFSRKEGESPSIYLDEIQKYSNLIREEYKLKDYLDPKIITDEISLNRKNILLGNIEVPEKYYKLSEESEEPFKKEYLENFLSEKKSFSSTELETYYICPKKYYYDFVLKFDLDKKTDHLILGIAVHSIFEDFYKIYREEILSFLQGKDIVFNNLEDFIEKKLRILLQGKILDRSLNHYVNLYKKLVIESIFLDLEDLKSHKKVFYPVEFEKNIEYSLGNYKIHGRVDRIERSLDGDLAITDFKLSKSKWAFGNIKNKKSLQLAIYFYSNPENIKYLRHLLVRGKEINTYYISDDISFSGTKVDIESEKEEIRKILISIIENINSGNFNEGADDYMTCNYCPYQIFCDKRCVQ